MRLLATNLQHVLHGVFSSFQAPKTQPQLSADSGETWNENFDHPEGWIFMHHENHGRPGFLEDFFDESPGSRNFNMFKHRPKTKVTAVHTFHFCTCLLFISVSIWFHWISKGNFAKRASGASRKIAASSVFFCFASSSSSRAASTSVDSASHQSRWILWEIY